MDAKSKAMVEAANLLMAKHTIPSIIAAYTSMIWHWCHLAWQVAGPELVPLLP